MSVISVVSPLGIEPRAKEPESFILSIKLRALTPISRFAVSDGKNTKNLFIAVANAQIFVPLPPQK